MCITGEGIKARDEGGGARRGYDFVNEECEYEVGVKLLLSSRNVNANEAWPT